MMKEKIFGTKDENTDYTLREGAYILPVKDGMVAVIETPKGYFFIGGGIEAKEGDEDCIKRECLEECGYTCEIDRFLCMADAYFIHDRLGPLNMNQRYYAGSLKDKVAEPIEKDHKLVWLDISESKGNMYAEMQNWALYKLWRSEIRKNKEK